MRYIIKCHEVENSIICTKWVQCNTYYCPESVSCDKDDDSCSEEILRLKLNYPLINNNDLGINTPNLGD